MKAALVLLVAVALAACGSSLKAPTVQGEPPEYVEPVRSAAPEAPGPPREANALPVAPPVAPASPAGDAGAP